MGPSTSPPRPKNTTRYTSPVFARSHSSTNSHVTLTGSSNSSRRSRIGQGQGNGDGMDGHQYAEQQHKSRRSRRRRGGREPYYRQLRNDHIGAGGGILERRYYIAERERKAQDTYMLYQCLMASLTSQAKKKVIIWADQFQIKVDGVMYSSGVALLKIIIRESHLDTKATTNRIRTKRMALNTYITTIDSNIGKFNQYVKLLVQSLLARNQTTSDLLINLFKGYGAVRADETFQAWLVRKQDDHEEGNPITPDELMLAAKNKYDAMVEKGTWNAPTAEEKIVTLKAKLTSSMKNLNKKVALL